MIATHRRARRERRAACLILALGMLGTVLPAGMAVAQDGEPRDTDGVCESPYDAEFSDVDETDTHGANILCLADHGITQGRDDGTYGPRATVRRDQMASFIARFIETASDQSLPAGDPGRFEDLSPDNAHRDNIGKLAAAEIALGRTEDRYDPSDPVTRGAMAAFIARAVSYLHNGDALDESRPPAEDGERFDDVDREHTHYAAIEALAGVGVVAGFDDGDYRPGSSVRRDQMASFVMRGYDYAVADGLVTSPLLVTPAFAVAPDDPASLPQDADVERSFVADVGDADEVVLQLAQAHLVDAEGETVHFAHVDGTARFGDVEATFTEVATGDTVIVGAEGESRVVVSNPEDGEISFAVGTENEELQEVVPVVYVADDEGDLRVDDTGVPLEPTFAVGGATLFADVAADLDITPTTAERRVDTGHAVTVTTVAAADADVVVPLPGDQVDFEVSHYDTDQDGGEACPAFGEADPNDMRHEETVQLGTDGSAELAYGAPETESYECIAMRWEGSGAFAGQQADGGAYVTYSDEASEVASVGIDPELRFADVGDAQSVSATVLDQYDEPMADKDVRFTIDRESRDEPTTINRTTDELGRASVSFSGSSVASGDLDQVTATGDPGGAEVDSPTGHIYYVVDAGPGDVAGAAVLGADLDAGLVYVQQEGDAGDFEDGAYLRFEIGRADEYRIGGDETSRTEWEDVLVELLDDGDAQPELTTDNHQQSGTTVYDLTDGSGLPLPLPGL